MTMKLNISYPEFGSQKMLELDDEHKIRHFFDKRISEEVPADILGDEFKGYVFKISGGFDKDGFAMKQGILVNHRVRIVLDGTTGFYRPKRKGCRKRKSVRGCITGPDLSCVNLVIVKRGPTNLPGLTDPDSERPSTRGPKRANNIRKLFGLSKDEDVRQFVPRKKLEATEKHKKVTYRSPKIQRLITPELLQRKRRRIALKKRRFEKSKKEASEYAKLLNQLRKDKRQAILSKKRASQIGKEDQKKAQKAAAPAKEQPKGKQQPKKTPAATKEAAKKVAKTGKSKAKQ